jgi:hypothetical protein
MGDRQLDFDGVGGNEPHTQQGESHERIVTSRAAVTAAERKRRQRTRERQTLMFERSDWQLFLDPATLPQKAGCQPKFLRWLILRELVDNARDAGANVALRQVDQDTWIVTDDGPGLDPADVPSLFAVNRPLLSSKRRRLPLRGMLGNGLRVVMGGVAASAGRLSVETRGYHLDLAVDTSTGRTEVIANTTIPRKQSRPGLTVQLTFGQELQRYYVDDGELAERAIAIAQRGTNYSGPSNPWWYGPRDLHALLAQVVPETTTVAELIAALGFEIDDARLARSLDQEAASALLRRLRSAHRQISPGGSDKSVPTRCPMHATLAKRVLPDFRAGRRFRSSLKPGRPANELRSGASDMQPA